MIVYTIIGALVFQNLETTNEKQQCIRKMNAYNPIENETAEELWKAAQVFQQIDDEENALDAIYDIVVDFRQKALALKYDGKNCSQIGVDGGPQSDWSFSGSLLFCVTVFTTVGYGNITPQTFYGRLVCIIYALVGTPLMLVFLANIGSIMADVFRFVYVRVCCCGCLRHRIGSNPGDIAKLKNEEEYSEDDDEHISVPITVTMAMITGYIFMGALLFSSWENWSMLQSAYYCFITIATIGFGDVVPGVASMNDTSGQFIMVGAALYLVFGMAIMSMAFNLIQEEMIGKVVWITEKLGLSKQQECENDGPTDQSTAIISEPKSKDPFAMASPMEAPYPMYKPSDNPENLKHMLREPSTLTNWAAAAISQNTKK
ncbi:hypothetical protein HELRODRAFT_102762 [Helobdella robusta]|uniref:Potassium channel domain-containing protein n=1 Tax=Helobdella robusta TaxID=6412 RepID=T1EDB5_HELRO|nr:hypothetical protein HELRODRAFT_102762 [Helobdella robusta]ESN94959.1 hypothetical protein HELRODRAFT_102762 [Helobdella robusta]